MNIFKFNSKNQQLVVWICSNSVKQQKQEYFKESDVLGKWFVANIEPDMENPKAQLNVKEDLLKTFWSSVNANSHIKQKNMIDWITENYGKRQDKEGSGYYRNGTIHLLQGFKWVEKSDELES